MKELSLIAEWIAENYPSAEKIIEIGVGKTSLTMEKLNELLPKATLIATDNKEVTVPDEIKFKQDDVTNPDLSIYQNTDLIFSIRTPPELYPPIFELAEKVKTDVLVKPVSSEESPSQGKLINYSKVSFYLLETSQER